MSRSRLVWTSDPEEAKKLRDSGGVDPSHDAPVEAQQIRVTIDRKGRAGKSVTVASGFSLTPATLTAVAAQLKKKCGAGGTARESEIEIQGEHAETVTAELTRLGYRMKR